MKKSEQTKIELMNALIRLKDDGKKISVTSISKEAGSAYGTFYRYFNNIDEIHEAAIIQFVLDRAEKLNEELKKELTKEGYNMKDVLPLD